jgi:uncharacterized membrane protein YagU involved in acid resistance
MNLIATFICAGFFSAFGWWGAQQVLPPTAKPMPGVQVNENTK